MGADIVLCNVLSLLKVWKIDSKPHNYFSNREIWENTVDIGLIFIRGINASHGYRCGFLVFVLLKSEDLIGCQNWEVIKSSLLPDK